MKINMRPLKMKAGILVANEGAESKPNLKNKGVHFSRALRFFLSLISSFIRRKQKENATKQKKEGCARPPLISANSQFLKNAPKSF